VLGLGIRLILYSTWRQLLSAGGSQIQHSLSQDFFKSVDFRLIPSFSIDDDPIDVGRLDGFDVA
jgi:hypothetical protein